MVREWNKWFINEGWRPNFDEIQEQFGYMVSARLLGEEQMSVTQAHYHDLYEREEQRYEKFKEILDAQ